MIVLLLRLPAALLMTVVILLGWTLVGLLLAVNAFYFLLTSPSTREAIDRLEAAGHRHFQRVTGG